MRRSIRSVPRLSHDQEIGHSRNPRRHRRSGSAQSATYLRRFGPRAGCLASGRTPGLDIAMDAARRGPFRHSSVAQLVERAAVNRRVAGSSPARGAMRCSDPCDLPADPGPQTRPILAPPRDIPDASTLAPAGIGFKPRRCVPQARFRAMGTRAPSAAGFDPARAVRFGSVRVPSLRGPPEYSLP